MLGTSQNICHNYNPNHNNIISRNSIININSNNNLININVY